ncbi:MAG: AAA family ATPase [Chloroflexota bacterium]|nr:AAA family ATPase [Chloroflexota bacterium]
MTTLFMAPAGQLRLKVALYGDPGTGKTAAALTFPRVALVDSERGYQFHATQPCGVVAARTLDDLDAAINAIRADAGTSFDTLVVDSLTNLIAAERGAARRPDGALTYKDHAVINLRLRALYVTLAALPCHVVVIAHEDDSYTAEGGTLKKTGRGASMDKSAAYAFDFILHMRQGYRAAVAKSRADALPHGHLLDRVTYDELLAASQPGDLRNNGTARAFYTYWTARGFTKEAILTALGVGKLSEYADGRTAADGIMSSLKESQT